MFTICCSWQLGIELKMAQDNSTSGEITHTNRPAIKVSRKSRAFGIRRYTTYHQTCHTSNLFMLSISLSVSTFSSNSKRHQKTNPPERSNSQQSIIRILFYPCRTHTIWSVFRGLWTSRSASSQRRCKGPRNSSGVRHRPTSTDPIKRCRRIDGRRRRRGVR